MPTPQDAQPGNPTPPPTPGADTPFWHPGSISGGANVTVPFAGEQYISKYGAKKKRTDTDKIDDNNPCGNPAHIGMSVRTGNTVGICFGCNQLGGLVMMKSKKTSLPLNKLRRKSEITMRVGPGMSIPEGTLLPSHAVEPEEEYDHGAEGEDQL